MQCGFKRKIIIFLEKNIKDKLWDQKLGKRA